MAGIRRRRANRARALTLRRPEHIPQHSRRSPGAIRHHGLNVTSGAVFQRRAEIRAFRSRPIPGHDVQASSKLRGRQRRYWRIESRLPINMFLPVRLRSGSAGLLVGNHGIGVIEHRIAGRKPGAGGFLTQANQPSISGRQINGQPRRRIRARRIILRSFSVEGINIGTIGIDERLHCSQPGIAVFFIINFHPHTQSMRHFGCIDSQLRWIGIQSRVPITDVSNSAN